MKLVHVTVVSVLLLIVHAYENRAIKNEIVAIAPTKPQRPGWVGASAARVRNLLSTFTPSADKSGCVDFSHKVDPYGWGTGLTPPKEFIDQLLTIILTQTPYRCIMIYDVYPDVIAEAEEKGFKVLVIIWLTLDPVANSAGMTKAYQVSRQYPATIVGFSCGSELGFRNLGPNGLTDEVSKITLDCLYGLKQQGVIQPIGVIDSLKTYNYNWTEIAANVDFFGVNM
jgi:hypothetical protein